MAPDIWVLLAAIAFPFLAAGVTPGIYRLVGERVSYVGVAVAATSFGLILTQAGTHGTVSVSWIPSLDIVLRLRVDGLALLFSLLASGIGVLIFVYASGYMHDKPDLGRFYMALLAFMGSILGVAFAADLVVLFLFWELTSVCSFVLIGYHTDEAASRYSARMAMVITVGGGLCLLLGAVLISLGAGLAGQESFDLAQVLTNSETVAEELRANGLFVPSLVLVTVAAAAKSAQVPLSFWLPRAMVAPTPVSAFLHSATMVKVGVYALGRLRPLYHGPEWTLVVATLGVVTMLVGALLAVISRDIKELLAYSTASHLGLMVAAFGFQSHYGAEGGAFHLFNHALFKAGLFLVAGILAHQAGTRHVDELGGLWRELPVTAVVAVVASLSMAGLPPFAGFYSKEIMFEAAWHAGETSGGLAWLYPVTAVLASVFTVLYSLRFLWLFLGDRPDDLDPVTRAPASMAVPALVLGVGVAVVSVAPAYALDFVVEDAATAAAVESVDVHAGLPTELSPPVAMSGVTIALGLASFPFYDDIRRRLDTIYTLSHRVHPNVVYDNVLALAGRLSNGLDRTVHNGLIRTYVWWVLLSACSLTVAGYAVAVGGLPSLSGASTPLSILLVLGVAIVAAVAVTTTESHVTGVLTLGILGFMVAIFYILSSGADLALTQLVVETLLLLIFLLVLEKMPAFYSDTDWGRVARDGVLAAVVGATATLSVLYTARDESDGLTETAQYYIDHAVEGGGGTNVVNVILTDFRAFDTLGESIVIVIAALSVLVLLTMRDWGETG
ncbi:multicomponent Na+:H+ antiporter subunit A [Halovenus aranensis]|uniref:Multicomponent Na+:H+ antiporter subunit A n=1 Tax=Halovenus aranensis TaxID=890420 RepID=A0A1G8U2Z1_9EURY|nr:hydrogen gas-evolving membrane-bound hydrogenase subunit E [Halovenus aranensis]SDJ48079.1 multicomponent Na+:H+ antiporter subunit A [Halovenus aranensis]